MEARKNMLLLCTGSVASLKVPELTKDLLKTGRFVVRVVVTDNAVRFFNPADLPSEVELFRDEDEWRTWAGRGDPVLHIELRKWAHLGLVAPMDANTLAKAAVGICDNLVTCCLRAWDFAAGKPLLFCPAMNTQMWAHPVTRGQVEALTSWGCQLVPAVEKTLVCGDAGMGAMAHVETIVARAVEAAGQVAQKTTSESS